MTTSVFELQNLEALCLESNSISEIDEAIGNLQRLRQLHLDSNTLVNVPNSIAELAHVEKLAFCDNQLENELKAACESASEIESRDEDPRAATEFRQCFHKEPIGTTSSRGDDRCRGKGQMLKVQWQRDRSDSLYYLATRVFDNGVYVPGEDAVIEQLRTELPRDWHATLLARDGDVTADVCLQIAATSWRCVRSGY